MPPRKRPSQLSSKDDFIVESSFEEDSEDDYSGPHSETSHNSSNSSDSIEQYRFSEDDDQEAIADMMRDINEDTASDDSSTPDETQTQAQTSTQSPSNPRNRRTNPNPPQSCNPPAHPCWVCSECIEHLGDLHQSYWTWQEKPNNSTNEEDTNVHGFNEPNWKDSGVINEDELKTILDFFYAMLSREFWQEVVKRSNKYAKEKFGPKFRNITEQSMYKFLAVCIRMGIIQMPSTRDYWRKDNGMPCPGVSDIMSRNCFSDHNAALCFAEFPQNSSEPDNASTSGDNDSTEHFATNSQSNPSTPLNGDILHKIRLMIEELTANCKKWWKPGAWVSIDESIIRTKCPKSGFRVYMKNKPHKWGYKVWCLVDCNGFLYAFSFYTGKKGNGGNSEPDLGPSIVRELATTLPAGSGIATDNFFTDDALMAELTATGHPLVGTVRRDRKFLKTVPNFPSYKPSDKGKYKWYTCCEDRIILCTWMDSKQVVVYSNTSKKLVTVFSCSKNTHISRNIPYIIYLYRKWMGMVDQYNRCLGLLGTRRMSKKWWKPIFWYLLDCAIVNAWIMYNSVHTVSITQKKFRELLAIALLGETVLRKRKRNFGAIISLQETHVLESNPIRAKCTCRPDCKSKTAYICVTCPNRPPIGKYCLSYHELYIRTVKLGTFL